MGQNWAITIGINQYRNLQRLNFAQRDGEAMRAFFRQELGVQTVYHFSDDSPPIPQDFGPAFDSQPTYATLRRFFRIRFEQPFLQPGDNLWFFFAGHGKRHADRDYLMPLDADPGDVEGTGIALNYITERLRRSGADNVILLVDACRNTGQRDGTGFGQEKQPGVITLFACSPSESSYEIAELQQGAFTHALLESLQLEGEGNCATVERLYNRLRQTVPQLTQQYKRLQQTPYGVIEPPTKYHLILLPRKANLSDIVTLKNDALRAEVQGNPKLAKQLWIRVLSVSPADHDAIEGIERLARVSAVPPVPPPVAAPPEPTGQREANQGQQKEQVVEAGNTDGDPMNELPIIQLPDRYNIARSAIYTRMEALEIETETIGNRTYVNAEQLRLLDNLHKFIQAGGTTAEFLKSHGLSKRNLFDSSSVGRSETRPQPVAKPEESERDSTPTLQQPPPTFEFEIVTIAGIEKGFLGIGTPKVNLSRRKGQAEYRAEDLGNGVMLEMVAIPGGQFQMGSPATEADRHKDESPQHLVTVPDFWMGKYPVTQAQWKAVAAWPKVDRNLDPDPSCFKGPNRPVEKVSWYDAVEFCARLSQKTRQEYRLPTEAEWEHACRARTTTPFHFGETITTDLANFVGNYYAHSASKSQYRKHTTEVGSFPANAFGLYDMHGNVWEWCLDHMHDNYRGAPTDGRAWIDKTQAERAPHVLRGGSWYINPWYCRSASRLYNDAGERNNFIGFRVVCFASRTS
jgi:formylglycine-generating enzyme required for sulfatase activity/uncharacterized caspase-like protein